VRFKRLSLRAQLAKLGDEWIDTTSAEGGFYCGLCSWGLRQARRGELLTMDHLNNRTKTGCTFYFAQNSEHLLCTRRSSGNTNLAS
jgi:hypothetical protein